MMASGYLGSLPPLALMSRGEGEAYFNILNLWYSLTVLLKKKKKIKKYISPSLNPTCKWINLAFIQKKLLLMSVWSVALQPKFLSMSHTTD